MQEIPTYRSLKERQRQEREELILQVAKEVLLEKGYHDTSIDEIAARVGIAKGTLYLHFAGKEDLVSALLESELQIALQAIEYIHNTEGTAQQKLSQILSAMYQSLFNKRNSLLYLLFGSADPKLVFKEKHSQTFHQIADHITALLEEGKATGLFDATLPTEIMLNIFFGVLSPRAYKHLVLDKNMLAEDFIRHIECIYFKGIGAPPSLER